MNILLVITGMGMGGAENVVVSLANKLILDGNRVGIVYLNGENRHLNSIAKEVALFPLNITNGFAGFTIGLIRFISIVRSFNPSVVHGHMYHANMLVRAARLFIRIPYLISTEHNKVIGGKARMFCYKISDFLSDLNTNVSEEATNYFIQHGAFASAKTVAVHNGINISRFQGYDGKGNTIREDIGIRDSDFVFLNVGRLTQAKNQKLLLKTFSRFSSCHKNCHLIIVGAGEELHSLKQYVSDLQVSNIVHFAGITEKVEEYYYVSDCFVLSSSWEGFGLVLAEAMASGLPVISTDAGGCAEVLDNSNFLVAVGDEEALLEKMHLVFEMGNSEREVLFSEMRESAKRFDDNVIFDIWRRIYCQGK